jgi:hypothetical protein
MRSYLVELYQPAGALTGPAGAERAREAAEQLTREGTPVRYLRSLLLPEDEICFHLFEGISAEAIGQASRRALLDYERIIEVLHLTPASRALAETGRARKEPR